MKKNTVCAALAAMMMLCGGTEAMRFEQPVKVGEVFATPSSGIVIRNATFNSGKPVGIFMNENTYGKGIAKFGAGDSALHFHYGTYPPKFGSGDINNAHPINLWVNCYIFQIKNDDDISMYMIKNSGSDIAVIDFTLLGRRKDGIWVKYFDTNTLIDKYFGANLNRRIRPIFLRAMCKGDNIVMAYGHHHYGKIITTGEFRFKWDEAAQWFGVEQVVY